MEFVEPEAAGPAEESGDEAVTDEETDLGTDWETVPSPRFCDIPSQVEPEPICPWLRPGPSFHLVKLHNVSLLLQSMDLSQSALQVSQPSANAGGMISSAAASVTSWFRAYTGQR